jgi:hypothetical protein
MKKLVNITVSAFLLGLILLIIVVIIGFQKEELTPIVEVLGYIGTFLICGSVIVTSLFPLDNKK